MPDQWIEAAAAEIMDRADAGVCITRDFTAIIQRHYDAATKCKACSGRGTMYSDHPARCNACHGTGKVLEWACVEIERLKAEIAKRPIPLTYIDRVEPMPYDREPMAEW